MAQFSASGWTPTISSHVCDASSVQVPTVVRGCIEHWPARTWTPTTLAKHFGDSVQSARFAPRVQSDDAGADAKPKMVWEASCVRQDVTFREFATWLGDADVPDSGPEQAPAIPLPIKNFWGYIDYKYFVDVFDGIGDDKDEYVKNAVDWTKFGVTQNSDTSTFWYGSDGAYTPCHYDTYGYNVVAQLYGTKRWTLFPPGHHSYMYPTRTPYEESSVYSAVNVRHPDLNMHPLFDPSKGHSVVLSPGDVLIVPRHWWHFVESLETSIAVNIWVDQPTLDAHDRLRESIVRVLACGLYEAAAITRDSSDGTELVSDHRDGDLAGCSMANSNVDDGDGGDGGDGGDSDDCTDLEPHPRRDIDRSSWLNPTETSLSHASNMVLLNKTLREVVAMDSHANPTGTKDGAETISTATLVDAVCSGPVLDAVVAALLPKRVS